MPGLVRGMVRTAAVVGTATATRNAVDRRQAQKNATAYANAMNQAYAQQPPPQNYAPPPPQEHYSTMPQTTMEPPSQEDMIEQLERLGALKAQGLLTDEEFAAAKQKLLAG